MSQKNPFDDPNFGAPKGQDKTANPFSDPDFGKPAGFARKAGDLGLSLLKGAVAIPEAAVGLADIPTGGRVGKFLENEGGAIGFRPKQAKEVISGWQSDDLRSKSQAFQNADGVIDKAAVAISNPSLVANAVAESLPLMGAGGVLARGLMAVAPGVGAVGAGAIGEGVMGAGSAAEQMRQETADGTLTAKQSALAGLSGAATAGFGALGGKVAQKLGIGDVDTMIAKGSINAGSVPGKGFIRRGAEGALSEGLLEELPQSLSEQAIQNIGLDKPIAEGMADAAVMGTLAGAAMGGGAGVLSGFGQEPQQAAPGQPPAPAGTQPAAPTDRGFNPQALQAEQNARLDALAAEEAGTPSVAQTAPPDGAAALAAQRAQAEQARLAQLEASRSEPSPDDEIFQSTGADVASVRPSQAMGLDPAAGPMSAAAALAVDGGATARVQAEQALNAAAEAAPKTKTLDEASPEERAAYDAATFDPARTKQGVTDRRKAAIEGLMERAALQSEGQTLAQEDAIDPPFELGGQKNGQPDAAGGKPSNTGADTGLADAGRAAPDAARVPGTASADTAGQPQRFAALSGLEPMAKATPGQKVKSLKEFMAKKKAEREAPNVQDQTPGTAGAQTQAAADQAPQAVGGQPAGAAAGVPAAGDSGVEATGVAINPGDRVRVSDGFGSDIDGQDVDVLAVRGDTASVQANGERFDDVPLAELVKQPASPAATAIAQLDSFIEANARTAKSIAEGKKAISEHISKNAKALADEVFDKADILVKSTAKRWVDDPEFDVTSGFAKYMPRFAAGNEDFKAALREKIKSAPVETKADLDKLTIPEMTEAQLRAAAEIYPEGSKRATKARQEIERRAGVSTQPTTVKTDGTQAPEAQQTKAQGPQAPAAAAAVAGDDEQGAQWNRMTTTEREAVATRAGLNKVAVKNLARRGWQGLDKTQQQNLRNGFVAGKAVKYELPKEGVSASWFDGKKRSNEHPDFEPTPRQQELMDAVAKALDEGVFYNRDLDERVASMLGVTQEQRASNLQGVDGGDFGYDVYHARKAVEAKRRKASQEEIAKELNLKPGDKLGTLMFNDGKVTNSVEVVSLSENGISASFKGKRGPVGVTFDTELSNVKYAIERAHEKGKRKDSYEQFIADRKDAPAAAPSQSADDFLPDGWTKSVNGYTKRPVYRMEQDLGQPFAVVTQTEGMTYEMQIRHGDKQLTISTQRGALSEVLAAAKAELAKMTQAASVTHQDPGEKPEAATKGVVADSLKAAAKNEDTKPSEMRKWLLSEIDKELLQAPDRADYDEAVKRMGEKDAISMFTGSGFLGKNAETGFITFDVPGDGKFKVRNSVRGLLEFRKTVMSSPGFKDSGQRTKAPEQNDGAQDGSGSKSAAVLNMIEEGDFEAARDYAEAVGINLEDVKVPRGDRKPQWEKFLKEGTLPPAAWMPSKEWQFQDIGASSFVPDSEKKSATLTRVADGSTYVATVKGSLDNTSAKYTVTKDGKEIGRSTTRAPFSETLRMAEDAMPEANDKPAPSKSSDTGWNMAGTGYGGKRYRGRNITLDDGREVVARIYENAGNYDEVEVKVDGARKFTARDSFNAQDKADAFIKTLTTTSEMKVVDKLATPDKMTPRQFDDWIRQRATIQTEQFRGDRNHGGGDEGVGYIHLSGKIEEGGTNWAGTARGAQDKRDTRLIFRTDDNKIVWYDDASQQVYEVPKDDARLEITRPEPTPKQALDPQEITVTVDGSDYTVTFDEPLATISNQAFQDNLDEYGTPGVAKAEFRKLRAQAQAGGVSESATTGTRRDPTKVSMFNPYNDGDIVTIDGQDWTIKQDTPGWYLTTTGNWRGQHPTIRNIKAMADLIREVEQAAEAKPAAQADTPKLTAEQRKVLDDALLSGSMSVEDYMKATGLTDEDVGTFQADGLRRKAEQQAREASPYYQIINKMQVALTEQMKAAMESASSTPQQRKSKQERLARVDRDRATLDMLTLKFEHPFDNSYVSKLSPMLRARFIKQFDGIKTGALAKAEFADASYRAWAELLIDAANKKQGITASVAEPAAAPKTVKQGITNARAKKAAEAEAQRAEYFTPGNILKGYGGHDRVLEYVPVDERGTWSVRVQRVVKQGEQWVDAPNERPRWHSTQPEAKEMAAGPVEKAAAAKELGIREVPVIDERATAATGVVENFGEKLPPARRAMAAKLSEGLTDDNIAKLPLSQIWPASENEAIEDTFAAAVAHVMRDAIPAKPRTAYKVNSWVNKVKMLRDFAAKILSGTVSKDAFMAEIGKFSALKDLHSKIKLLEQIDRAQWKRIGEVSEAPNAVRYEGGTAIPVPSVGVSVDGKNHWLRGSGDVLTHLDAIKAMLGTDAPESRMQFEIRQESRGERKVFINKKGDKEQRRLMEFATVAEARKAINEQYADLVAAWEGVKARDNITERDLRSDTNRERAGKDHRKGRDVTPAEFESKFGFRGGEFGKWVGQGNGAQERQFMLNSAYDALMDLSDLLGIPPKAISLEGSLGIAFGSRGSGWASAHFEPSNLVINLTKTRGAGALAHEWFHALDNYFARKRGGEVPFDGDNNAYRRNNYVTYKTGPLMVRKDGRGSPVSRERLAEWRKTSQNSAYLSEDQWIEDPNHKQGVRAEVERAFADLVKALNDSPMLKRAQTLDGVGRNSESDGYWSRVIERAARAFENYVQSKMMEQGYHNDFLANVKAADEVGKNIDRYPYLLPSEVAPVADAFQALFDTIKTRQDDAGNVVLFSQGLLAPTAMGPKPTVQAVQALVGKVQAVSKDVLPVSVVGNPSEVPGLQVPAGTQPTGVLTGGRIYLFADNFGTLGEAYATLFHEIFHLGLQRVIPAEDYASLLKKFANGAQVQNFMRQWKSSPEGRQRANTMPSAAYEALATEEALAMVAEELSESGIGTNRMPGLVKKMLSWLADVADRLGFPGAFGNWVRGLTQTQAERFVSDMTRAVLGGARNLAKTQAKYGTMAKEMTQQTRLRSDAQEAELAELFNALQAPRGVKLAQAQRQVSAHPMAEQIRNIEANFMDMLAHLDDAKLVQINC